MKIANEGKGGTFTVKSEMTAVILLSFYKTRVECFSDSNLVFVRRWAGVEKQLL